MIQHAWLYLHACHIWLLLLGPSAAGSSYVHPLRHGSDMQTWYNFQSKIQIDILLQYANIKHTQIMPHSTTGMMLTWYSWLNSSRKQSSGLSHKLSQLIVYHESGCLHVCRQVLNYNFFLVYYNENSHAFLHKTIVACLACTIPKIIHFHICDNLLLKLKWLIVHALRWWRRYEH